MSHVQALADVVHMKGVVVEGSIEIRINVTAREFERLRRERVRFARSMFTLASSAGFDVRSQLYRLRVRLRPNVRRSRRFNGRLRPLRKRQRPAR